MFGQGANGFIRAKKNEIEYQIANLVAGKKTVSDELVSMALTCKYMGWDFDTYNSQPLSFIQVINLLRQLEAEEVERSSKQTQ